MTEDGAGRLSRVPARLSALLRRWRPALTGGALSLLALLLTLSPCPSTRAEPDADLTARVAELRELSLEPIPVEPMTRDELRQMLLQATEEELADIAVMQELDVFLDLLGEEDDLYDMMVESNTRNLLGFYAYREGRLCLITDSAAAAEPVGKLTLAHEYTHALQDQHFGLSPLLDRDGPGCYEARLALAEGDATMVMAMYLYQYMTLEEQAAVEDLAMPGTEADAGVPEYLARSWLFPYQYGVQFVMALWEEDGWEAVNRAYEDPPVSTEQIMHPRKYFRHRDEPVEVALPDLAAALGPGWSEVDSGVLGEFDLMVYLWRYMGEGDAEQAAEGWGGDRYSLLRSESGEHVFVLSSCWDEADDAQEFYDACVERYPDWSGSGVYRAADESRGFAEWQSRDLLYCRLALDGQSVHLVVASGADAGASGRAMSAVYQRSSRVWVWVVAGVGALFLVCALIAAEMLIRRRLHRGQAVAPVAPPDSPVLPPGSPPAA